MQGRSSFRYLFIFILLGITLSTPIFASNNDNKAKIKNLSFYKVLASKRNPNISEYFFNIAEAHLSSLDGVKLYTYNKTDIDSDKRKDVISYFIRNGMDYFFLIESRDNTDDLELGVELISSDARVIYKSSYNISTKDVDMSPTDEKMRSGWLSLFDQAFHLADDTGAKNIHLLRTISLKPQARDFPIININVNLISAKIFFDERINSKVFSAFPISARVTFFPLKYFESGLFVSFNFDNIIYKYYDLSTRKTLSYNNNVSINYGFFFGVAYHSDRYYFATGVRFNNIFYHLPETSSLRKTNDYRSYWLPQFGIYQRVEFRLFKFINYSISVNIRTIPLFYKEGNLFYSKPFSYDFVVVEFVLFGISMFF